MIYWCVQEVINTGLFHMKSTCRHCHGQGKVITTPCTRCGGRGTTTQAQQVNVQVPAGVSDGQTVRVPVGRSEAHVLLQVSSWPQNFKISDVIFSEPLPPAFFLVGFLEFYTLIMCLLRCLFCKITLFLSLSLSLFCRWRRAQCLREMGLTSILMSTSALLRQFSGEK